MSIKPFNFDYETPDWQQKFRKKISVYYSVKYTGESKQQ